MYFPSGNLLYSQITFPLTSFILPLVTAQSTSNKRHQHHLHKYVTENAVNKNVGAVIGQCQLNQKKLMLLKHNRKYSK